MATLRLPPDWRCISSAWTVLETGDQLGYYSIDANRRTKPNSDEFLRCLKLPDELEKKQMVRGDGGWDLHEGMEDFDGRDEFDLGDKSLVHLFNWLSHGDNAVKLDAVQRRCVSPLIVCPIKALIDMSLSVFDQWSHNNQGMGCWPVVIFKHKGMIFCQEVMTQKEKERKLREKVTLDGQLMTFRGHKFAQCITTDVDQSDRQMDSVVSNKPAFVSLRRAQLGNHNLLVNGRIDAVDEQDKFIEIKTMFKWSRIPIGFNPTSTTHRKWLVAWLECQLLKLDRVVLGKHVYSDTDTSCILQDIGEHQPSQLCSEAEQDAMLGCLEMVLDLMVENVEESNKNNMKYYMMEWNQKDKQVEIKPFQWGDRDELKVVKPDMLDVIG